MVDRFGYGEIGLDINPCRGCDDYDAPDGCKSNGECGKPITNADRIRSMSDEELAVLLEGCICPSDPCKKVVDRTRMPDKKACQSCWLYWLKSPVEVDE